MEHLRKAIDKRKRETEPEADNQQPNIAVAVEVGEDHGRACRKVEAAMSKIGRLVGLERKDAVVLPVGKMPRERNLGTKSA
ncbi:MAG: hypothetical protein RhofKO_09280 [Rhodothermales bacterium]